MTTKQLLTVSEASMMLGIGRTVTYQLIREGSLRSIQVGKRSRRIPVQEISAYIDRALQQCDVLANKPHRNSLTWQIYPLPGHAHKLNNHGK